MNALSAPAAHGKGARLPFLRQRTRLILRAREMSAYLADRTRSHAPAARHVLIFAQGRSGTTLLESLLCSTGHFTGLGEALDPRTREVVAPLAYVRGLGRMARPDNVVVHVKGSHLSDARRRPRAAAPFLKGLVDDGWTVVRVLREGIADQVLSECLALTRGAYHKTDDSAERLRIHVDAEDFARRCERRLRFQREDESALDGVPHLVLSYEADLSDAASQQAAVDRVLNTVGLPSRPVTTSLRKIGGAPTERLANFEEVSRALAERGIEWTR